VLDRPQRRRAATARTRRQAAGKAVVMVEVGAGVLDLLCRMNGLEEREALRQGGNRPGHHGHAGRGERLNPDKNVRI
jgi:hypothetical protein